MDDCYEPDSDPDLSDVEAPYSDDEDEVQVGVERGGAVEDGAVEVQDAASAERGVEEECPPAMDAVALEAEAEAKTKRFEEMKKRFNRGKGNHNVVGKGLRNPADLAIKRRAVSMHKQGKKLDDIRREVWNPGPTGQIAGCFDMKIYLDH